MEAIQRAEAGHPAEARTIHRLADELAPYAYAYYIASVLADLSDKAIRIRLTKEERETVNEKYELTEETIEVSGHVLHRIRALTSFAGVKAGELGGFVESEENLSQFDTAWVGGSARVYDTAWVSDNARVYGEAQVYGDAWISGSAQVYDRAQVYGDAEVHGKALVCGDALVCDDAYVCGDARVCGEARICGNTRVNTGVF